jgi:hypothetical protein
MNTKTDNMSSLELEVESLRDEIRYLKADQLAKDRELDTARQQLQILQLKALQEAPAAQIGSEVRMRYVESHRRRMGLPPSNGGKDAKKSGDRAAHRGRPLVDAWLYGTGQRKDAVVYKDLYGISFALLANWKDIPEVVEVCGFHASLKSDGTMTEKFKALFNELFDAAAAYSSGEKLAAAFKQGKILLSKYSELQNCYDAIIAANPPRWRGNQSTLSP